MTERRAQRVVAASFIVATLSGLALLGLYLAGGQTQLEGLLLTMSLGGIGVGIVVWGQALLPDTEQTENRGRKPSVLFTGRDPADGGRRSGRRRACAHGRALETRRARAEQAARTLARSHAR